MMPLPVLVIRSSPKLTKLAEHDNQTTPLREVNSRVPDTFPWSDGCVPGRLLNLTLHVGPLDYNFENEIGDVMINDECYLKGRKAMYASKVSRSACLR